MKLRALILCDDQWHPAANIRPALEPLCRHDFDFEFSKDGAKWLPDGLSRFGLVVFARANIAGIFPRPEHLSRGQ